MFLEVELCLPHVNKRLIFCFSVNDQHLLTIHSITYVNVKKDLHISSVTDVKILQFNAKLFLLN